MPGRESGERLALLAAALVLVALLGSAVLGVLRPRTGQPAIGGSEPSRLTAVDVPPVARGRLEVLNAAGRAGLARQATETLRTGGFDVVFFGNAPARADSSEVIDRAGRPEIARAAAERLGIRRVRSDPDSTLLLDATVVLGRDWGQAPR